MAFQEDVARNLQSILRQFIYTPLIKIVSTDINNGIELIAIVTKIFAMQL